MPFALSRLFREGPRRAAAARRAGRRALTCEQLEDRTLPAGGSLAATALSWADPAAAGGVPVLIGRSGALWVLSGSLGSGDRAAAASVGDFNGDGRDDLAVADPRSGQVSILLGLGDGSFRPFATLSAGLSPSAVTVADFDGDGAPDLAVASRGSDSVSVFQGAGDGTFRSPQSFAVGDGPVALAVGDFNGDGRTDLAAANRYSNDVSLLLGQSDGRFAPPQRTAAGAAPTALAAGDFNGDGRDDLAVLSSGTGEVVTLLGRADGSFAAAPAVAVGGQPTTLAAGDFNNDGRTDLAVADRGAGSVAVYAGRGDGTFLAGVAFAAGDSPAAVAVSDFNGDGRDDLAIGAAAGGTSLLLSKRPAGMSGEGLAFAPAPAGGGGGAPQLADFTGDGVLDSVSLTGNGDLLFRAGLGTGRFGPAYRLNGSAPAGDFVIYQTAAGTPAVAAAAGDGVTLYTLGADGRVSATIGFAAGPFPSRLIAADFDGDGRDDLAATDASGTTVAIALQAADGSFAAPLTWSASFPVAALAAVGADGRTGMDLVVRGPAAGESAILSVDATLGLTVARAGAPAAAPESGTRVSGDFTGDGVTDVAVLQSTAGEVWVYTGRPDGSLAADPVRIAVGAAPTGLAAADVDGDGHLDLAVGNGFGDVLVLLNSGAGSFALHSPAQPGAGAAVSADFNGDGLADTAFANPGGNSVTVLLARAGGESLALTYYVGTTPTALTAADFNGDGLPDLAVANYGSNDVSVLLGQGQGDGWSFARGPRLAAGAAPVGVSAEDYDGDGVTDLVVTGGLDGAQTVLPGIGADGRGTGFFRDNAAIYLPPPAPAAPGGPSAAASADPRGESLGGLLGDAPPAVPGQAVDEWWSGDASLGPLDLAAAPDATGPNAAHPSATGEGAAPGEVLLFDATTGRDRATSKGGPGEAADLDADAGSEMIVLDVFGSLAVARGPGAEEVPGEVRITAAQLEDAALALVAVVGTGRGAAGASAETAPALESFVLGVDGPGRAAAPVGDETWARLAPGDLPTAGASLPATVALALANALVAAPAGTTAPLVPAECASLPAPAPWPWGDGRGRDLAVAARAAALAAPGFYLGLRGHDRRRARLAARRSVPA